MRIRSIKPEFWRSDDITALPREVRLLFIGLWSYVDDNGVGIDDYRQIAADLFAFEDDQKEVRDYVRDGLATLSRVLLLDRYEVDGKAYLFVRSWDRHQKIDRPGKVRLPRPPEGWNPPTSGNEIPESQNEVNSRESRETIESDSLRARVNGTGEQGNRGRTTKTTTSATAGAATKPDDLFDEFWKIYPRKVKKQYALAAWKQVSRKVDPDRVIAAARAQVQRWRVEGIETKYVPHPASWLRGGSYDDEPEPKRLSLVPTPLLSTDPIIAFDELRKRADARQAASLIGIPWVEPSQHPSDPTPFAEWRRSQQIEFINAHEPELRAVLNQRHRGVG